MTKKKCKAKTKKGYSCNKFAMKGSVYCYIHSFWKRKNIPFYKNSTYHFLIGLIGLIITASFNVHSTFFDYSKKTQKTILDRQNALKEDSKELKENNEIIKEMLDKIYKKIETNEENFNEELLKKYPLGYILFFIDSHKKIVLPFKKISKNKFEINWQNIQLNITNETISLYIPYLLYGNIKARDIVLKGGRQVLSSFFGGKTPCVFFNSLFLCIEILSESPEGIIGLLGVKEIDRTVNKKNLEKLK